jgi:parvulin-like peptidyl-prolyl isomerase
MIFSLEPGELGGPVESPAGWHLVRVQDVRDAAFTDIQDDATRKLVRRKYLHDELDRYTADLRKNRFPVEVYEDHLIQLAQQEADMVKRLAEKARAPGSVTEKRVEELQKYMRPAN